MNSELVIHLRNANLSTLIDYSLIKHPKSSGSRVENGSRYKVYFGDTKSNKILDHFLKNLLNLVWVRYMISETVEGIKFILVAQKSYKKVTKYQTFFCKLAKIWRYKRI